MPEAIKVIVVDGDAEERKAILDTLASISDIIIAGEADSAENGIHMIEEVNPGVTIVGNNIRGGDGFGFCESVAALYPIHAMILVTSEQGEEVYRKAMRAGVKEIVHMPVNQVSLSDAVYRAFDLKEKKRINLTREAKRTEFIEKTAKIISVFSTKGGVGKTTISSNLAVLMREYGKKVALLDLDVYSGDIALAMDIVPKRNLSDLVSDISKLDLDLLESYMIRHSSGVMVLPAPMRIEYADFVAADHVKKILKVLVNEYDYIIIDCACYMHDPVLVALDVSDVIVLVTTMDIFAIKNLKSCAASLEASNYSKAKFRLVINRASRESGISEKDIETTMGIPVTTVLPQEESVIIKSINQGSPAVISYKKSGFSRGMHELAKKIAVNMKKGKVS